MCLTKENKPLALSSGGGRSKGRSGELDFWKFIFSLVIVIRHSEYLPTTIEYPYFRGGSIFVEFFFITSGYLMAKSAERKENTKSLVEETSSFLRKKITAFYPYLIFWISCISCSKDTVL